MPRQSSKTETERFFVHTVYHAVATYPCTRERAHCCNSVGTSNSPLPTLSSNVYGSTTSRAFCWGRDEAHTRLAGPAQQQQQQTTWYQPEMALARLHQTSPSRCIYPNQGPSGTQTS